MRSFRAYVALLVLLPSWGLADNARSSQRKQIGQLIEQLGSQQYAQRRRAEAELRYQGAEAIEQLLEAQYHDEHEISLAARQILNSLTINWTRPNEHPIVEQIFKDYDSLDASRRIGKAEWLAKLEDGVGFPAVGRIVRYERSDINAKKAALSLIESFDYTQTDHLQSLSKALRASGGSGRAPMQWLQTLREEVVAKQSLDLDQASVSKKQKARLKKWNEFAEAELSLGDSPRTNKAITAKIHRYTAERAMAFLNEQSDDTLARQVLESAVTYLVDSNSDDPTQLLALGAWLLDENQVALFQKWIWKPHQEKFRKDQPQLVYLAAESYLKTEAAKAEKLANEAFAIYEPKKADKPKADEEDEPKKESDDLDSLFPDESGAGYINPVSAAFVQINTAIALEDRGMTEWAIREYQRLMKTDSDHWRIGLFKEQAAIIVSELLHDRGRDEEAADALATLIGKETIEIFADDEEGRAAGIASRMEYFRAEQYRQQGDRAKQIEHLRKAIKVDKTDADVLIAMHRLPRADERWKRETKKLIREAVETFEAKIQEAKAEGEIQNRAEVAKNLNQIAWLVGNTEGNYKRAIEQSRRSLELRPHSPGSLDTLGRTYFAVGDIENALKYQRRAVKLEPHSQQIARQLAEFEMAASQGLRPKQDRDLPSREPQEATP